MSCAARSARVQTTVDPAGIVSVAGLNPSVTARTAKDDGAWVGGTGVGGIGVGVGGTGVGVGGTGVAAGRVAVAEGTLAGCVGAGVAASAVTVGVEASAVAVTVAIDVVGVTVAWEELLTGEAPPTAALVAAVVIDARAVAVGDGSSEPPPHARIAPATAAKLATSRGR